MPVVYEAIQIPATLVQPGHFQLYIPILRQAVAQFQCETQGLPVQIEELIAAGIVDIVAGDAAVLVNPHNIEEISEAINEVCGSKQLRESLIAKGIKRAKLFNWDTFAHKMKDIYAMA